MCSPIEHATDNMVTWSYFVSPSSDLRPAETVNAKTAPQAAFHEVEVKRGPGVTRVAWERSVRPLKSDCEAGLFG
jgi:hypothetical protein